MGTTEARSEELSWRDDCRGWREGPRRKRSSVGTESASFDPPGGDPLVRLYTLLRAPQVPQNMHARVFQMVWHQKGPNRANTNVCR